MYGDLLYDRLSSPQQAQQSSLSRGQQIVVLLGGLTLPTWKVALWDILLIKRAGGGGALNFAPATKHRC